MRTESSPSNLDLDPKAEIKREIPALTVYVLRHGKTESDKTKDDRGLTEEGIKQMEESALSLLRELDPKRDIIQLFDSDNDRVRQSNNIMIKLLSERGFKFLKVDKVSSINDIATREIETQRCT